MIRCETCNEQIAKNANPCPKCGANRTNYAHKIAFMLVMIVVAFGLLWCNSVMDKAERYHQTESSR